MGFRTAAILGLLLLATAAGAHDADVIYVQPRVEGDAVGVAATLTAQTLSLLAPVDSDGDGLLSQADAEASAEAIRLGFWEQARLSAGGLPCAQLMARATVRPGDVLLEAGFRCGPGEVRQDFRFLSVLPKNYQVSLGPSADKARGHARFPHTALTYRAEAPPAIAALPPPPAWVWAIFLAVPCALLLFERRRF